MKWIEQTCREVVLLQLTVHIVYSIYSYVTDVAARMLGSRTGDYILFLYMSVHTFVSEEKLRNWSCSSLSELEKDTGASL